MSNCFSSSFSFETCSLALVNRNPLLGGECKEGECLLPERRESGVESERNGLFEGETAYYSIPSY